MTITGEIKSQVDAVWDTFWAGGISNPIEVVEQLTYLLFVKGLDETQLRAENKANRLKEELPDDVPFPAGDFTPEGTEQSIPSADLRWGALSGLGSPKELFARFEKFVFPYLRERVPESTHNKHMVDAKLTVPPPELLQKVFDGLDAVKMEDRDTEGPPFRHHRGAEAVSEKDASDSTSQQERLSRWGLTSLPSS